MHHATVCFECEGGFEMKVASPFPVENKGYVVWCKKTAWRGSGLQSQPTNLLFTRTWVKKLER